MHFYIFPVGLKTSVSPSYLYCNRPRLFCIIAKNKDKTRSNCPTQRSTSIKYEKKTHKQTDGQKKQNKKKRRIKTAKEKEDKKSGEIQCCDGLF